MFFLLIQSNWSDLDVTETSDAPQNERYYNSHESLREADAMYADFGASTGDNGSFGWHAEFPVNAGY